MDQQLQEINIEKVQSMDNIERKDYRIWKEEGILWVEYLSEELGIDSLTQGVNDRLEFIKGEPQLTIMDARKVEKFSRAALIRCQQKDAQAGFIACAIVTDKGIPVLLFYLIQLAIKTPFALKLFTSMNKAENWIKSLK